MSEPSQTAKERAERVWDNYSGYEGKGNFIPAVTWEITAAEQAAFQRGKEAGRQEEKNKVLRTIRMRKAMYEGFENSDKDHGLSTTTEWAKSAMVCEKVIGDLEAATDPPAQPAATEPAKLDDRPFGQRLTDLEARVQRLEEKT